MECLTSQKCEVLRSFFYLMILFITFMGRGLCLDNIGPNLSEILFLTNQTKGRSSLIMTSQACGILVGSLVSETILLRINTTGFFLFASCLLQALSTFFVPRMRSFVIVCILFVVQGLAIGMVGIGVSKMIHDLKPKKNASWFQTIYLGVAVGALLGPFIVEYFQFSSQPPSYPANKTLVGNTTSEFSDVYLVYDVMSFIVFLPCLVFFYQGFNQCCKKDVSKTITSTFENINAKRFQCKPQVLLNLSLLFLISAGFYGMQDSLANYLVMYTTEHPLLNKTIGLHLTKVFWASIMVTRFLSIFVADAISGIGMMFFDLIGISYGTGLLILMADRHEICVWLGIIILGFSFASFNAATFSMAADYFHMSHRFLTIIFLSRCFGLAVFPLITSNLMELFNYSYLFVSIFVINIFVAIFMLLLIFSLHCSTFGAAKPVANIAKIDNGGFNYSVEKSITLG